MCWLTLALATGSCTAPYHAASIAATDLSAVVVGAKRAEVEATLGPPEHVTHGNGVTRYAYEYNQGKPFQPWNMLAAPFELVMCSWCAALVSPSEFERLTEEPYNRQRKPIWVLYDQNDVALAVCVDTLSDACWFE